MHVRIRGKRRPYQTVWYDPPTNQVCLIDQRLLPHRFKILKSPDYQSTARMIQQMAVRGAGAIAATAAYGLAQGLRALNHKSPARCGRQADRILKTLAEARPTAVDPLNAMKQVLAAVRAARTVSETQAMALRAAQAFAGSNVADCRAIGQHGAPLIQSGMRILTHCNAGWLAFVDIGSATAPLYAAHDQGRKFHVFCDETRPRSQGASLTAWELAQEGISHEIIVDSAAGHLMQRGQVDLVIVGSDRTLGRTGDVANKIGTYTVAVLAKRHRIPFYVAIPFSTIDWALASGAHIPIEERDPSEVGGAWGLTLGGRLGYVRVANPTSSARNPGFDVTPPELITGIITPAGILKPRQLWAKRKRLQSSSA